MHASIPLYRAAKLRHIEAQASDQPLMARAGEATAAWAERLCTDPSLPILILAGPGNNGGDAFETARRLNARFFTTHVVFPGAAGKLPGDATQALHRFLDAGGTTLTTIPERPRWSLLIDGLFGIGLRRPIASPYTELIAQANALAQRDRCPLLALDCPSGLDADTGKRQQASIRASHTISFIGAKPGLFTADGPDHCGNINIATLGLDAARMDKACACTIGREQFAAHLVARRRNSHKGSHGNAGILGGERGMAGAALLAGRAALYLGSGRVYLGLLDPDAPSLDMSQIELMLRPPEELPALELNALACGPGMGTRRTAASLLKKSLRLDIPLLLDADALNLLAATPALQRTAASRHAATLLTPHPAEAARLLACDVTHVQEDRLRAATDLAKRFNAFVALKGCGTVVASPQGECFINTSGNPGLATAGSGDVLSGIILALLAQGWPAQEALLAGVHLHGEAADRLVARGCGPVGLTAGELIASARASLNRWIGEQAA